LAGLLATGKESDLAALEHGHIGKDFDTLADAIVASWYSGIYDSGHGEAVATFDQALMWNALTFTKPFGWCGGDTGYWTQPPQS